MSNINLKVDDTLSLIEQNFEFLHAGKFLSHYIKQNNLSTKAQNLTIYFEEGKTYCLNGLIIRDYLESAFINNNKPNTLGYFVTWNAFRGIGMAMTECFKEKNSFRDLIKKKLGDRYEHFKAIFQFIRNVLSHNVHNEIRLKKDDYDITKTRFTKKVKSGKAKFEFNYIHDLPEICTTNGDYGFKIIVDFTKLNKGDHFINIVHEWELYMLMELSFNFVKVYRQSNN